MQKVSIFIWRKARRSWEARKVLISLKWIPVADIYHYAMKSLPHVCLVFLVRLRPSTIQSITGAGTRSTSGQLEYSSPLASQIISGIDQRKLFSFSCFNGLTIYLIELTWKLNDLRN